MSEPDPADWIEKWSNTLALAGCHVCDAIYLIPYDKAPLTCPLCAQGELLLLDEEADRPIYTQPPELAVPFSVPQDKRTRILKQFLSSIWIKPDDLKLDRLNDRVQSVYLPMWLVDADVQAQWWAETGYNYEVISHREQYQRDQWRTQRVRETKIRWEPRAGRLQRHYDNKIAPALEEHDAFIRQLGWYRLEEAEPYRPEITQTALVRLPNRPPDDAWPEAQTALRQAAQEECRQAAAADHIREFRWTAEFANPNWTQLLLPLYTTWYQDDDGRPQMVYLHGQTGKLYGRRRASLKKARRYALVMLALAALAGAFALFFFLLGLFIAPGILALATLGFLAALFFGILAIVPVGLAWYTNHTEKFNELHRLARDTAVLYDQKAEPR